MAKVVVVLGGVGGGGGLPLRTRPPPLLGTHVARLADGEDLVDQEVFVPAPPQRREVGGELKEAARQVRGSARLGGGGVGVEVELLLDGQGGEPL